MFRFLQTMGSTSPSSSKFLYFAYGSNLSTKRIRLNNPSAVAKTIGLLKGYRLEFSLPSKRWKGSAANIIKDDDEKAHVRGVVWELSEDDSESLNKQEGVALGIYERFQVVVETSDGPLECLSYQLTTARRDQAILEFGEEQTPSPAYKEMLVTGAKEHGLPKEYIEYLESIEHNYYDGDVDLQAGD